MQSERWPRVEKSNLKYEIFIDYTCIQSFSFSLVKFQCQAIIKNINWVCEYLSLLRWFLGYWTFSTSELFNVVVSKLYFWIFLIFFSQLKLSAHKLDWYLAFITLTQKLMSCLFYFCACWHQAFYTWNDSVKHEILCFNQNDFLLLLMWPFSWRDLINKFIW